MKLIVCVDNNNGIMFNNRRVSKDSKVIEDITKMVDDNIINCSNYSLDLFKNTNLNIVVKTNFQYNNENEYYFLEDEPFNNQNVDEIIIYNWNRNYPSDKQFNFDLTNYNIINTYDFVGTSHEKITKSIYKKDEVTCKKEN